MRVGSLVRLAGNRFAQQFLQLHHARFYFLDRLFFAADLRLLRIQVGFTTFVGGKIGLGIITVVVENIFSLHDVEFVQGLRQFFLGAFQCRSIGGFFLISSLILARFRRLSVVRTSRRRSGSRIDRCFSAGGRL